MVLPMRSCPQGRILCGHLSDESAQALRNLRSTGLDFQRQKRRKPLRCQRRNVSGLTLTRAPRQEKMRPRITMIS
jgi:hypothetical protein